MHLDDYHYRIWTGHLSKLKASESCLSHRRLSAFSDLISLGLTLSQIKQRKLSACFTVSGASAL